MKEEDSPSSSFIAEPEPLPSGGGTFSSLGDEIDQDELDPECRQSEHQRRLARKLSSGGSESLANLQAAISTSPLQDKWIRRTQTNECLFFYVCLVAINILIFVVDLVLLYSSQKHTVLRSMVLVMEGIFNLVLFVDFLISLVIFKLTYFRKPLHILNALLVLVSVGLYLFVVSSSKSTVDVFETALLIAQLIVRSCTLLTTIRTVRQKRKQFEVDDVKFALSASGYSTFKREESADRGFQTGKV